MFILRIAPGGFPKNGDALLAYPLIPVPNSLIFFSLDKEPKNNTVSIPGIIFYKPSSNTSAASSINLRPTITGNILSEYFSL